MSSGDESDSEIAEWEREQMLRGTQSRARHQRQNQPGNHHKSTPSTTPQVDQKADVINASLAKRHVQLEIEETKREIELTNTNIGSTKRAILYSRKQVNGLLKQIEELEASNTLFKELQKLVDPSDVLDLLDKHGQMITKLPADQKEMIDLLEKRMRATQTPMVIEQDD